MKILRYLKPWHFLAVIIDLITGYSIICFYYDFSGKANFLYLGMLLLAALLLTAGYQLWKVCFAEENNEEQKIAKSAIFLVGCLLALAGLLTAMSVSLSSFLLLSLLLVLMLLQATVGQKTVFVAAFLAGFMRALNILLGMSFYPLFEFAFNDPPIILPALLVCLYLQSWLFLAQKNAVQPCFAAKLFALLAALSVIAATWSLFAPDLLITIILGSQAFFLFLIFICALFGSRWQFFLPLALALVVFLEIACILAYSRGLEPEGVTDKKDFKSEKVFLQPPGAVKQS